MANTTSAKKAQRAAEKRAVYNARRKKAMKDAVKQVSKLITGKKKQDAESYLPTLFQALDKAAKTHVIHSGTAARIKSRVAKRIKAIA